MAALPERAPSNHVSPGECWCSVLAGMQYVLGDLEADDGPSVRVGK